MQTPSTSRFNSSVLANSTPLLRQDQQNGGSSSAANLKLPAVPADVINRIRRGEFVNFDNLLPSNIGKSSSSKITITNDGERLCVANNSTDSSSSNSRNFKSKVRDFFSWSLAWTLFFQIMIQFRSHLAGQLLQYQLYITNLANQYTFWAWYKYDQAFRRIVANNDDIGWDSVDEGSFNMHVRGQSERVQCYHCGASNHLASSCPSKGKSLPLALSRGTHLFGNNNQSPRMRNPGPPPTPPFSGTPGSNPPSSVFPNQQQSTRPPFPTPPPAGSTGRSIWPGLFQLEQQGMFQTQLS